MVITNHSHPKVDIAEIRSFENKINGALPSDYLSFLCQHNGGRPEHRFFFVSECQGFALIDHFLGFGIEGEDINQWMDEFSDDLRGEFIPIGFDPGGNPVLLRFNDGRVYYWDSARHFDCSTDSQNTYRVADSFSDFMLSLLSVPGSPSD